MTISITLFFLQFSSLFTLDYPLVLFQFSALGSLTSLFSIYTGLPSQHFSYVKNIDPGLPLFLFNYSERKLNGIFEAASSGQININPYGWTTDGSERTLYPAQVLPKTFRSCSVSPNWHDCEDRQWLSPRKCSFLMVSIFIRFKFLFGSCANLC